MGRGPWAYWMGSSLYPSLGRLPSFQAATTGEGSGDLAPPPMSYTGSAPASSSLYWKGMESSGDPPILAGKP